MSTLTMTTEYKKSQPVVMDWLTEIDAYGESPLTRAAKAGASELTNLMVVCDIDETLREVSNEPPLHRAAYWGYEEAIMDLIAEGADPSETNSQGETPLHKAARLGHFDAAQALVEGGAEINAADMSGMTPLHWAALNGREAIVELLLDNGADPYVREWVAGGLTPIDVAKLLKYTDLLDLLERKCAVY